MPNWRRCSTARECVLPHKGFQYFLLWQIRRGIRRQSLFLPLFPRNIPRCRVLRCITACIRLSMPDLYANLRLKAEICVTTLRRKARTAILYAVYADGYSICLCRLTSKNSYRPDLLRKVWIYISGDYVLNAATLTEIWTVRSVQQIWK